MRIKAKDVKQGDVLIHDSGNYIVKGRRERAHDAVELHLVAGRTDPGFRVTYSSDLEVDIYRPE